MPAAYRVDLTRAARKQLGGLPSSARSRIVLALQLLAETPRPPRAVKLVGRDDQWRIRTGDYRVIYRVEDERLLVLVIKIGHRKDVYR